MTHELKAIELLRADNARLENEARRLARTCEGLQQRANHATITLASVLDEYLGGSAVVTQVMYNRAIQTRRVGYMVTHLDPAEGEDENDARVRIEVQPQPDEAQKPGSPAGNGEPEGGDRPPMRIVRP